LKKYIIILSVAFLASCSAKIIMPSQSDAERGRSKFPGLTVDDLNQGEKLFNTKCTQCHGPKRPKSWTEEQWRKIVPAMAEKATISGKKEITQADQDLVLKYVITMGPDQHGKR